MFFVASCYPYSIDSTNGIWWGSSSHLFRTASTILTTSPVRQSLGKFTIIASISTGVGYEFGARSAAPVGYMSQAPSSTYFDQVSITSARPQTLEPRGPSLSGLAHQRSHDQHHFFSSAGEWHGLLPLPKQRSHPRSESYFRGDVGSTKVKNTIAPIFLGQSPSSRTLIIIYSAASLIYLGARLFKIFLPSSPHYTASSHADVLPITQLRCVSQQSHLSPRPFSATSQPPNHTTHATFSQLPTPVGTSLHRHRLCPQPTSLIFPELKSRHGF